MFWLANLSRLASQQFDTCWLLLPSIENYVPFRLSFSETSVRPDAQEMASSMGFDEGNGENLVQNHLPIAVTLGDGNATMQSGNSNIHQLDQLQVDLAILP